MSDEDGVFSITPNMGTLPPHQVLHFTLEHAPKKVSGVFFAIVFTIFIEVFCFESPGFFIYFILFLFTRSFIRVFVHSFVRSLVRSFVLHLFIFRSSVFPKLTAFNPIKPNDYCVTIEIPLSFL